MNNVIGIQFNKTGRMYYFSSEQFDIKKGDKVIVQTERGMQFGFVMTDVMHIDSKKITFPLKSVVRIASKEDENEYSKNVEDAAKAMKECEKTASKYNLNMRLIDAEYTFDRNQLLFHFFSENRVDFRSLAKDLASRYRTRIELRQVGVRDKAKEIGGLGLCGRKLCCSAFLDNLDSVSINMAKTQNISLNPTKINGCCGRLLCCLRYENDLYEKNRRDIPNIGETVKTNKGQAKVIALDVLSRSYKVIYENNDIEIINL